MANQAHPTPTSDTLRKFRILYGCVRQHFREVEQRCGISGSQLWLLQEIDSNPGIGVSELAERLSIHQSTCSLLVEKLVGHGYVEKTRGLQDQRRVGLTITEAAKALLSVAPGPATGIFPDVLRALSEAELAELDRALSTVITKLQLRDDQFADKPLADL